LLSACLICQGKQDLTDEASYQSFFKQSMCQNNPSPTYSSPKVQTKVHDIHIPSWAMIQPTNFSGPWNLTEAQNRAEKTTSMTSAKSIISTPAITSSITTASTASASSEANTTSTPSPSTTMSSGKMLASPGTIAAATLGSLALLLLLACGAYIFRRYRRRVALRPRAAPKMDLADPGIEEGRSSKPIDLLDGEEDPSPPTFPFPFEWFVRRYHPNAPHSIQPSRTDAEPEPVPIPPVPRAPKAVPSKQPRRATDARTTDQLEQDGANIRGSDGLEDTSSSGKPAKTKARRRMSFSFTGIGKQSSISSPSMSAPSDSMHSAHAERRAEGKYYHLPPSAQFLANVARYPQNIDPERPW
ncbi:hypothetical protein M422DRAFT_36686, partial [Sphaerobolus stellatus SS14]